MHVRHVPATTVLALLVVLAGCSGVSSDPAAATPTADAATVTTDGATASTGDRPPAANASNTVAYEDLSAEAQAAFATARDGYARFVSDTKYVDGDPFAPSAFEPYRTNRFVERNGTYYAVLRSFGDGYATYHIETERVASADGNATAVANLSASVRSEVRWAIENGSYATPLGKWSTLPAALDGLDTVRFDGVPYRLRIIVGDARVQRVHLDPAE